MKKKIFNIALIFLLIVNISSVLTMIYNKYLRVHPSAGTSEAAIPLLHKELKLNEAQAAHIEKSRLSFEQELDEINLILSEKRAELLNYIRNSQEDTFAINRLIDEIAIIQADIQKKAMYYLIQEKNSLTLDQQEKYFSVFESRFRKGWMYRQGGRGQGWRRNEQQRQGRGFGRRGNRGEN